MLGNRAIRTSFVVSFVGHCLFLIMPGFNVGLSQTERCEEITVKVEIEKPPLLPKIDVMGEEKKLLDEVSQQPEPEAQLEETEGESEPQPSVELVEESEPLVEEKIEVVNPAQEAMLRYQDMVKQRIEEVRRYPAWAKKHGIEGEVQVKFAISSSGLSQDIEIIDSSGYRILDEEAVDTIKRASPFPPVPEEIGSSLIPMRVVIVFTLKYE